MPFFWIKEGSNFVAIKFSQPAPEKVAETFASPSTTDNVDTELLSYLKGMNVGDAIEINLKDSGLKTERSLKVRIGKHAKLANREMENRAVSGGFIFRVTGIIEEKPEAASSNGTATTTQTEEVKSEEVTVVDQPLQEATARGRR
jgi:hypothetical protein